MPYERIGYGLSRKAGRIRDLMLQDEDQAMGLQKLSKLTGVGEPLGCDIKFNTQHTWVQLAFTFALSDSVDDIIQKSFPVQELLEYQVLEGIKVLDIGCSHIPAYARCARAFGADAYTLDIVSGFYNSGLNEVQKKHELDRHLCLDVNDAEAVRRIDRDFDLITGAFVIASHRDYRVETPDPLYLRDISYEHLKEGGYYLDAGRGFQGALRKTPEAPDKT